ncbi:MAG TPA: sensor histidine kinase [Gaiellaceae bacterium]|nr:sensor histidine kinase [Gaiellaceae bacterium]
MRRIWPFARHYWLDLLVVVTSLASALEVALTREGPQTPHTTQWFTVPAVVLIVVSLLGRRRLPFAAPAALWVVAAAVTFVDGRLVASTQGLFVAGLFAAFLLGHLPDSRQGRVGLATVLGGAAIVVYNDPSHSAGELVFTPILFAIAWLAGFALYERATRAEAAETRAAQAERDRESAARLAVAEERARIARELHDIVAHSVSVMVLQVGAVRHRLPGELEQDRDALQDVERTGRAALAEMRRLLGAMRSEQDELDLTPQPGLGSLEPLLDEIRRSGLPVELHLEGEPVQLPHAIDLSAYRIIQEGLTNALKHAHAGRADVVVRYRPDELRIDVRDDGRGPATSDGAGHGLVGIGERVKLYGGTMTAGPAAGGGFALTAQLPLRGAR